MSEVLGHFLQALRASDLRVSTAEGMDAALVIGAIGFDDRQLLKTALSQVLAKSTADKASFDECFERFFRAEDLHDLPPADDAAKAHLMGSLLFEAVRSQFCHLRETARRSPVRPCDGARCSWHASLVM